MKKRFYFCFICIFISLIMAGLCLGQRLARGGFRLNGSETSAPLGNAINDILIDAETVWVGVKGLSKTSDLGETWTTFTRADGLGMGGISAMDIRNSVIWVATLYDSTTELGTFHTGGGLAYSEDDGENWYYVPQPVDSRDETRYKPTTTVIQNSTYDLVLTDSAVWIASWGGGLRKSTDQGETWQVVTVDGLPFDALGFLTHIPFSIAYDGNALWVGTAGGIHKSKDGGESWITFTHQNQTEGISGNWVVDIACQKINDQCLIWASTLVAEDEDEFRAVSVTDDGGLTWRTTLDGKWTYNFAFDDSVVYVATDQGLYKSVDYGMTWAVFPQIFDMQQDRGIYSEEVYCASIGPKEAFWIGTADGLALSMDGGSQWKIFRSFMTPGKNNTPPTYAYPNPFSPLRHNLYGGDGHVRFQYRAERTTRVTLKVYDFGMNLVKTVVDEKNRSGPGDYAEIWDGKNEVGEMVANGVYFYKLTLQGEGPLWGKVMVVN